MKKDRLEQLYEQTLTRPEVNPKELPLDHILKKSLIFYPNKQDELNFDNIHFVEIGPGRGDFLFRLAQENPKKNILGIEIGNIRFKKLVQRLEKSKTPNLTLILGDARVPFHKHFKDNTIEKCFILFPDPWPKNKHRHLRLLQKDFLKLITNKLTWKGEFTLATDVKDYATWVMQNVIEIKKSDHSIEKEEILRELPDIPPTFFSEKWKKMGREFWFVRFKKV